MLVIDPPLYNRVPSAVYTPCHCYVVAAAREDRGHVHPGRQQGGGRRKGNMRCGNFLRLAMYKNSVHFVEAEMGMEGQIRCRTMHILDVISSVSRSSKCPKIVSVWGSPQTVGPSGALTALLRPLAGFKRAYF